MWSQHTVGALNMGATISNRTGRLCLMVVVLIAFLMSMASLFWLSRGGAIHPVERQETMVKLVGVYLPLLSLIGAFYFGGSNKSKQLSSLRTEAFVFAIAVTSIWVLTPVFFLWLENAIEDVVSDLDKVKLFGDTLALAAIGFYFSRD